MNIYRNVGNINSLFEISRRALLTQSAKMNVTGNNIAHVNTEGYTRQVLGSHSSTPLQNHKLNYENGVTPGIVKRMRDTFFDFQLRNENPALGRWEEESHQLTNIESILNDGEDISISRLMDKFFESWEDLSNDPESQASRTVVKEAANMLSNHFKNIDKDLTTFKKNLNDNLNDKAKQINYYIREIHENSQKILRANKGSQEINTLMDRRDLAIDKLSRLIDIDIEEKDQGSLNIYCNGIILADDKNYNQIKIENNESKSQSMLFWENENRKVVVEGGSLKAILNVRDEVLPNLRNKLNKLVNTLVSEINIIHRKNYNLEGKNGFNFFDPEGLDIGSIKIADSIEDDLKNISISKVAGSTGNADGALELVDLAKKSIMDNNTDTMGEFYKEISLQIGSSKQQADQLYNMEKDFVLQLENKRNEVTDVNLDEELSNMIQLQQAYGAATKILNKTNEMIRQIISLV